jgi:hypothetical protein
MLRGGRGHQRPRRRLPHPARRPVQRALRSRAGGARTRRPHGLCARRALPRPERRAPALRSPVRPRPRPARRLRRGLGVRSRDERVHAGLQRGPALPAGLRGEWLLPRHGAGVPGRRRRPLRRGERALRDRAGRRPVRGAVPLRRRVRRGRLLLAAAHVELSSWGELRGVLLHDLRVRGARPLVSRAGVALHAEDRDGLRRLGAPDDRVRDPLHGRGGHGGGPTRPGAGLPSRRGVLGRRRRHHSGGGGLLLERRARHVHPHRAPQPRRAVRRPGRVLVALRPRRL